MAKLTMEDVNKRLDEIRTKATQPQGNTVQRMLQATRNKLSKKLPRR